MALIERKKQPEGDLSQEEMDDTEFDIDDLEQDESPKQKKSFPSYQQSPIHQPQARPQQPKQRPQPTQQTQPRGMHLQDILIDSGHLDTEERAQQLINWIIDYRRKLQLREDLKSLGLIQEGE